MLNNIIKYNNISTVHPNIAVRINGTCDTHFVEKLKTANVSGIVPAAVVYGEMETAKALEILINNNSYWPPHIINSLSTNNIKLPLHIFFRTGPHPPPTVEIVECVKKHVNCDFKYCSTWEELSAIVLEHPASVIFKDTMIHEAGVSPKEFVGMFNILLKCNNCKDTIVGVLFTKETTHEIIRELMDNGVECFIPEYCSFGKDVCLASLHTMNKTLRCIPSDIIKTLTRPTKTTKNNQCTVKSI